MKTIIQHIVKEPFYIGTKLVYSYAFYEDYSQYLFYDKNGWVIATISAEKELDNEEEVSKIFGEEPPKKRKEFMW